METRDAPLAALRPGTQPVVTINQLHQMTGKKEVMQAQDRWIAKGRHTRKKAGRQMGNMLKMDDIGPTAV